MPEHACSQRRTRPDASTAGDGSRRSVALATALALLGAALQLVAPGGTALAQQQTVATQGGRGGGDPVEIVADSLVVEQDQRLATFAGNVDAVQGTLRLRSDRLLVYYDAGQGEGEQPAAGGGGQGIRRLEASGNVSIASPGQTASGDRGTYEVAAGQVTLEGNVVLTRADNVVRGAKLDSNLRTGVSTVSAAQPGASGKPEQRVRALFVPGGGGGAPGASGGSKPSGAGAAPGAKKAP